MTPIVKKNSIYNDTHSQMPLENIGDNSCNGDFACAVLSGDVGNCEYNSNGISDCPSILTPPANTILPTEQMFTWTGSEQITNWWLYLGSTELGRDILDSGNIAAGSTSLLASSLPSDKDN